MKEPEFRALLDRYLKGNASPEERKLLDQFFDSYRDPYSHVDEIDPEIKQEILYELREKESELAEKEKSKVEKALTFLKIAAVVSFVAVGSYVLLSRFTSSQLEQPLSFKTIEYKTTRGQKADVELPDGTRVKLNSNSHISYPAKFEGSIREVDLEGEAYFDVTHDAAKPFIVHTGDASTKVLGTSFNVNATGSKVTVTLVEGKVNVSTATDEATLTPNQQATIRSDSRSISTQNVDVTEFTAWKNNRLIFENVKLEDAFTVLENWYNVDITVNDEALNNCVITAKYENESLENVLSSFHFMLKIDYTINERAVIVSGKGCN